MMNTRSNFFYANYNSFMLGIVAGLFLLLGMVVLVLYQVYHRPLPQFFALALDNKRLELVAFNEPNYLPDTILKWANKAAVASYNFDFVNYLKQISEAGRYYTEEGWRDYKNSVSNVVASITQRQIFVNSVVSGAPIIALQGMMPGKGYMWRVQMPFLVTYQAAEETSRENFFVVMSIVKIPTTTDPMGIGIDQFIMR